MTPEQTKKLIEALETGLYAAQEVAQIFHRDYKGYRHAEHEQVDKDVMEIQDAIKILESMLQS